MEKGKVIAVREGGDTLVYDYTDKDGLQWGHVERGEEKFPVTPVLSIIARGYWEETEEYEEKRQVRDADFWGAPVGTPLPLPPGFRKPSAPKVPRPRVPQARRPSGVKPSKPKPEPKPEEPKKWIGFESERFGGQGFLKYGELDFETLGDAGDFYDQDMIDGAMSDWGTWEGNYAMRVAAANMIGLDKPPSLGQDALDNTVDKIITTGKIGDAPEWATEEAQRYIQQAWTMMGHIDAKAHQSQYVLYRGIAVSPNDKILDVKKGDTLDWTLSAFTPCPSTAMGFTDSDKDTDERVIFVLDKGAFTAVSSDPSYETEENIDGAWVTASIEEVTQGTFEVQAVFKKEKIRGMTVTKIFIKQIDTWTV